MISKIADDRADPAITCVIVCCVSTTLAHHINGIRATENTAHQPYKTKSIVTKAAAVDECTEIFHQRLMKAKLTTEAKPATKVATIITGACTNVKTQMANTSKNRPMI